jgi:hypothetical protein
MASEINIQAILALQRSTLSLQASGNETFDQTPGTKGLMNLVGTTASPSPFTFPGLNSLGMFFAKNLDSAGGNYIEISLDNFTNIFAKLQPKQFCLIPINKTTVPTFHAKAGGGTPNLLVGATEI